MDQPQHLGDQALHQRQEVVAVQERRLDVDLRELGLPVLTQVFVTEAADDLEVALEPGHHQELFEELRRLGQRVEAAAVQPARDQEVARALRRRPDEERRLHLQEAVTMEIVARRPGDRVADGEVAVHGRPSEVEIPVRQPRQLVDLGVVLDGERQRPGLVEDADVAHLDLDLAGGQLGVLRAGRAAADDPANREHEFAADGLGPGVSVGTAARIEDTLREPGAVAQVDEDEAAMIAPAMRPSHQRHRLPSVTAAQDAARVRAPPTAQTVAHAVGPRHCHVPSSPTIPIRVKPRVSRSCSCRPRFFLFSSRSTGRPWAR